MMRYPGTTILRPCLSMNIMYCSQTCVWFDVEHDGGIPKYPSQR